MDNQHNYLTLSNEPTFQEKLNHALASLFLMPEAFPIYPDAEKSYHPVWKNHEEVARRAWAERDGEDISGYRITKVFSVKTVDWMEFLDTEAGNSEHDGIIAEVERADGWTGRYCLEITLAEAIATLQAVFAE